MKESKTNLVQQKVLSDYEKKRIERLKQNVNFMAAKGYSSLASKIFQEKLQFASVRQEELNDEDQDNTLEEEGDEAGSNVGSEAGGSNANNAKVRLQYLFSHYLVASKPHLCFLCDSEHPSICFTPNQCLCLGINIGILP